MLYLSVFIVSFLASIFTGLLGIGGGILIIPGFLFISYLFDLHLSVQDIVLISMQCIFINSSFALWSKRKQTHINIHELLSFAVFIFIGTLLGSMIRTKMSDSMILVIYLIVFTLSFYLTNFSKQDTIKTQESKNKVILKNIVLYLCFCLVGAFSSIIGIGGALFYILVLKLFYRKDIKSLVPSSTILVFITSISMLLSNSMVSSLPLRYLPILIISSLVGVRVGNYLYLKSSEKTIQIVFNLVLILSFIRVALSI